MKIEEPTYPWRDELPEWMERAPQTPPLAPPPAPPKRRGRRTAALLTALALVAGAVGFAIARSTDDGSAADRAVVLQKPATGAAAPPASQDSVSFVAQRLSPSVVQIETQAGLGSGVIYDSDGLILTAAHVVAGAGPDVTVRLADGTRVDGHVVGSHTASDVAVISVDMKGLPAAELASDESLRVGQLAVAIGSPFGLEGSVTAGVVSAIDRAISTDNGYSASIIQTDAPINPGNSGGALADSKGRVIGINDAIRSDSGVNAGVGFAIPVGIAKTVADDLVAGRTPQLGFLGIQGTEPSDGSAGALIIAITPGSAAEDAGLREGDVISSYDGEHIEGMSELAGLIHRTPPGTTVTLEVVRGGDTIQIKSEIGGA